MGRLDRLDTLPADGLRDVAAKIVALAFQVCQDTEASFRR
jgi:hypothetical protein